MGTKPPSIARRLMDAGIGRSYAYMIANGSRKPPLPLAIEIYRKTGLQFGPLKGASPAQLKALAGLTSVNAA